MQGNYSDEYVLKMFHGPVVVSPGEALAGGCWRGRWYRRLFLRMAAVAVRLSKVFHGPVASTCSCCLGERGGATECDVGGPLCILRGDRRSMYVP
jgi:hypothetical protein